MSDIATDASPELPLRAKTCLLRAWRCEVDEFAIPSHSDRFGVRSTHNWASVRSKARKPAQEGDGRTGGEMLSRLRRGQLNGSRLLRRLTPSGLGAGGDASSSWTTGSVLAPRGGPLFFTPSAPPRAIAGTSVGGERGFSFESNGRGRGGKKEPKGSVANGDTVGPAPGPAATATAATPAAAATAQAAPAVLKDQPAGEIKPPNRRARRAAVRAHALAATAPPEERPAAPLASTSQLPFVPLPAWQTAHAKAPNVARDAFFAAGRPLLEIEVPDRMRRSPAREEDHEGVAQAPMDEVPHTATEMAEQGTEGSGWVVSVTVSDAPFAEAPNPLEDTDLAGSPSDPAFKAPHASNSGRPAFFSPALEDEIFGVPDPNTPYLLCEPEGVDPEWPEGVARFLAGCEALVAPKGTGEEVIEAEDLKAAEEEARRQGRKGEWDEDTVKKMSFLAPFGLHPPIASRSSQPSAKEDSSLESTLAHRVLSLRNSHHPSDHHVVPPQPLPDLRQSPLDLTLTAARFLHNGLLAQHYRAGLEWGAVADHLEHAQQSYIGSDLPATSSPSNDGIPGIRGALIPRRKSRLPRSQARRLEVVVDGLAKEDFPSEAAFVRRLREIIQAHESSLSTAADGHSVQWRFQGAVSRDSQDVELGLSNDVVVGEALAAPGVAGIVEQERMGVWAIQDGPRLLRPRWVWMDSVKRKRKRKMNVHK